MSWTARRHRNVGPSTADARSGAAVVFRPVSAMRSGQVIACSFSLLAAGVLLARGFIGLVPGRPVFLLLGLGLGVSAVLGLAIDHVEVRTRAQRPDHVLVDEVNRSRRFGHQLVLVRVDCTEDTARWLVGRLRSTDWAWRRRGATYLLLVETDRAGARELIERQSERLPTSAFRLAVFPDDALTVGALHGALRPLEPTPGLSTAAGDAPPVPSATDEHADRSVRLVTTAPPDDESERLTAEG